MITDRLHAIQNRDTASTSSAESDSDDRSSLMDVEWHNLEDSHYRLNPLWPENISDSLPPELQPFLLSGPVRPHHLQDNQTDWALLPEDDERVHPISEESSLSEDETDHSISEDSFGDETDHSIGEQSPVSGDDKTHHIIGEEPCLFGDSDEMNYTVNDSGTSTPTSLPQDRAVLPNVGSQPPAWWQYHWAPSNVRLQHPGVQHDARMPSSVGFQPSAGPHYPWAYSNVELQHPMVQHNARMPSSVGFQPAGQYDTWASSNIGLQHPSIQHNTWMPSNIGFQPLPVPHHYWMPPSVGASSMVLPPPNPIYPYYATNTAFPPHARFYPSANASTASLPRTTSFRHGAHRPGMKKT
ncbi:uncharacterized protein EDB93DRAFT_1173378 [Suillus bovinus]|uniref:uncharacterized protein n=1 Tax=Suillus bovinus TaxID=48563 RepID=UPI001B86A116|nr:uncharacterized protein EDB93DRAFT_1173378 [Suillus bovinus]KAG2133781.1 hypothetical protein EDB93DRAFT_1173378 [Suillus bovinus]